MPPAVIGVALVAAEAVTAATLGYIALGVTVAGMVTGNKTLQKIGGQLGLGAGIAGIATSFMGAGASAVGDTLTEGMSAAAEDAANIGATVPSGQWGQTYPDAGFGSYGEVAKPLTQGNAIPESPPVMSENLGYEPDNSAINDLNQFTKPTTPVPTTSTTQPNAPVAPENKVTDQVSKLGTEGEGIGANAGNINLSTANDTNSFRNPNLPDWVQNGSQSGGSNPQAKPDAGWFDKVFGGMKNADGTYKDSSKYMMMEGGKIVAGGIQGLSQTSNMNAQLAENRRVGDIQRSNIAQTGKGRYGLMSAR